MAPRRTVIEVTTSVHQNEHLERRLLQERGGGFGVKGISLDKQTGEIASKPYTQTPEERVTDLADLIIGRLRNKEVKRYPPGTVLIVNCITDGLIYHDEWNRAVARVAETWADLPFRELFLVELIMSHSTTLYGNRKPRHSPRPR